MLVAVVVFENLLAAKRSTGVTWGTFACDCCVGVRNFWLFLIVFVHISCFKLKFLRKAIMSCELLNISLKLLSMFNVPVLVPYFL